MNWGTGVGRLPAGAASPGAGLAADPRYPDWPCAQAKVPEISLAAVWAGPPLDDVQDKWKNDAKVSALVSKLAARRIPLEEAQKDITEFLTGSTTEKTTPGQRGVAGLLESPDPTRCAGGRRRGRGQGPVRYGGAAGVAGCIAARSAEDRRARQPTDLGDPDF